MTTSFQSPTQRRFTRGHSWREAGPFGASNTKITKQTHFSRQSSACKEDMANRKPRRSRAHALSLLRRFDRYPLTERRVAFHGGIPLPRPITVKVKRALGSDDLPLPTRMTEHAAGFDLCAAVIETVTLLPGDIRLIPCGFS